jgi:hypothetical protein
LNAKSDYSSCIEFELVEQGISKLSYFDPYDNHGQRKACNSKTSSRYNSSKYILPFLSEFLPDNTII